LTAIETFAPRGLEDRYHDSHFLPHPCRLASARVAPAADFVAPSHVGTTLPSKDPDVATPDESAAGGLRPRQSMRGCF
jgi:hypothetical protein